jgi:hypothetical protein
MARSSRAKIIKGVWTRKVPIRWKRRNGRWRTAIDMSVLEDPRLRECRYIFEGDSTVSIAVEELRRAVVDGPSYDERKWGPFDIDPKEGTVAGHAVQMRVLHNDEAAPKDSPEISQLKRELEALQSLPQNPETLRQIQRVLKMYERPSAISRYVKRTRGDTCQFCGQRGFVRGTGSFTARFTISSTCPRARRPTASHPNTS